MRQYLLLLLLTIGYFNSSAQDSIGIKTRLDDYLKSANKAYRFNGTALVLKKGEVLINRGYGYSDMKTMTLNSPETRFPILSITKSLTATVILKLQDEGKLSVDDNVAKFFPDYPNGSKIKLHHLLTHSSGIHNYTEDVGIEDSTITNYPISKDKILEHFKNKLVDFSPGKRYSYNNSGYFLLGLIIEKVTGQSYESVVREIIFRPLKMTQSGFDFNKLPKAIKAQGYEFWNEKKVVPYKHYDSTFAYSAGSVYSTTTDFIKWSEAVSSRQIITPKTWELAFRPKINGYGYGWQTGQFFEKKYVRHSGGYPGFMSEYIYYPDEDITIVLFNNFGTYGQNVWSVGMGISCIVLQLPYDNWKSRNEISVDKNILVNHVGRYQLNQGKRINIKLKNDGLYAIIDGLPSILLHAENDNKYFFENFNTTLTFDKKKLIVHEHGGDSVWTRKD